MLTKTDLDQIRKVVKEEVKPVSKEVGSVKKEVGSVREEVRSLDKKLDMAQEDISEILTAIDKHQSMLENRVYRLEEEVGLSPQ